MLPNFLFKRLGSFLILGILLSLLFLPATEVWAKRPPETRNQEEIQITPDMHGRDLNGYEFIKADLRGVDLSGSDLRGAVFNNSLLEGANLSGADMKDLLAYSTDFDNSDLRDANLTNSLLMESSFENAKIKGADFTDAIINRIQQKELCSRADGINSSSGISTDYSLGC
tara:strand:- start:776 stop:1285 length:510 start_codon:yes stop_codon:yes gene_type:complete